MIVRTASGLNREVRTGPIGNSDIPLLAGMIAASGEPVTVQRASAIPAVLNAIRLIAETTGRLPLRVYSGFQDARRTREESWQWDLLHRRPNPERSAFDFWQDVAACIETYGNAYVQKAKSRRRVEALLLIEPWRVMVKRDRVTNELKYVIVTVDGSREFTRREILHIRGLTPCGGDQGVSPIQNEAIGTALARYSHEGNLYRNNAAVPYALKFEGKKSPQQAAQVLAVWKQSHSGGSKSGNPGVLSDGAGIEKLGLTMEDAQFIESHEFSVKDVGRMFNISASLLNGADTQPTEEESRRFLNFGLWPRLCRITEALRVDEDLFPQGSDLYPEFYVDDFIRADALTRAQIRHYGIQDGTLLADEARAEDGRPALPDGVGQIPQITPVGGAPNPAVAAANGASQNGSSGD